MAWRPPLWPPGSARPNTLRSPKAWAGSSASQGFPRGQSGQVQVQLEEGLVRVVRPGPLGNGLPPRRSPAPAATPAGFRQSINTALAAPSPDTALHTPPTPLPRTRCEGPEAPAGLHACPGACDLTSAADLGVTPLGDALPAEQVAAGRGCHMSALLQAQCAQGLSGNCSLLRVAPVYGG